MSALARQESRHREVHLPPVSVYRWWARRTTAVSGALLDAVAQGRRLKVVDPFSGGGVIPLTALARGHDVFAQDLNPWAVGGLAAALSLPPPERLRAAGERLHALAAPMLHRAYTTADGTVAHSLRVAVSACTGCGHAARLFPRATVSLLRRKDRGAGKAFVACPSGHLHIGSATASQPCPRCAAPIDPAARYLPQRVASCPRCGRRERLSKRGKWGWELVLVEVVSGQRRVLRRPTTAERIQALGPWAQVGALGAIPRGQETAVLRRHGLTDWAELYPARQQAVIMHLLRCIPRADPDPAVQSALRMAVLGSAEMAGYLSRWDRAYLKSYEAMAGHRFNLTTLSAEPNVWGAAVGRGTVWRRLRLLEKAARWRADCLQGSVQVRCGDSAALPLATSSTDLVLTDPPYHDDVQYAELALPLRAWAGMGGDIEQGQTTAGAHGDDHRRSLQRIFSECRRVLKPTGRLIFSYANRDPAAWSDLLAATAAAGFSAAGYTILHSENETDASKRDTRAHTCDLILDLVPTGRAPARPYRPPVRTSDAEEAFLRTIGDALLHRMEPATLTEKLRGSRFLQ